MLTKEQIINDLNQSQALIDSALNGSENSVSSEELKILSEKIIVVHTWFIKHGYVEV